MQKILIISPYFFPNINPRPYRWTQIALCWAEKGYEVHVLTEKNTQSPNEKIILHQVGYSALKSMIGAQRGEVKESSNQNHPDHQNHQIIKPSNLQILNDFFWKKIYFPDDSCVWYFSAKRKVMQLLENQQFDVVISSALPFTAHLIALKIKEKYPNLKWIADTGDPFALQKEMPLNNSFFYKKLNYYFEKKVLQNADSVTFTTENCLKIYEKGFPEFKEKYSVIPPLLTVSEVDFEKNEPQNDGFIHFAYFGKFYEKVREPKSLIDFYEKLIVIRQNWQEKVKIHIYGDVFPVFQAQLQKPYIVLHGLIPREKVGEMMQKANILINISNITDYQLPSKAPDYLFAGKPILNLFCNEKDCFSAFFQKYPLIFNLHHDEKNYQNVVDFIEKKQNENLSRVAVDELCAPYSLKIISEKYELL